MRYQKRLAMPNSWPLAKKAKTTYVISPIGKKKEESMTILALIRDLLKLATTKKEVKKILAAKEVLIDNKPVTDEKYPAGLLDIISIPKLNKYYRLVLEKNKLRLHEIPEKDSNEKICKVVGKKQISQKTVQINLYGGKNIIYSGKVSVNDSILLDLKQNKVIKTFSLKEGAKALILFGKHSNKMGEIKKILSLEKSRDVIVSTKNGEIRIPLNNVFVIG